MNDFCMIFKESFFKVIDWRSHPGLFQIFWLSRTWVNLDESYVTSWISVIMDNINDWIVCLFINHLLFTIYTEQNTQNRT